MFSQVGIASLQMIMRTEEACAIEDFVNHEL
jgi:hypothetical protein